MRTRAREATPEEAARMIAAVRSFEPVLYLGNAAHLRSVRCPTCGRQPCQEQRSDGSVTQRTPADTF